MKRIPLFIWLSACSGTQVGNPLDGPADPDARGCDAFLEAPTAACDRDPVTAEAADPETLRRYLANACPGDAIELGFDAGQGDFNVPAGVTVRGDAAFTDASFCLRGGEAAPTRLERLSVAGDEVLVRGHGGRIELSGVVLIGGTHGALITEADVDLDLRSAGAEVGVHLVQVGGRLTGCISGSATHGLAVSAADALRVEALEVVDFESVGAVFAGGDATLDGLSANGPGECATAESADALRTQIQQRTLRGRYGVVGTSGVELSGRGLHIESVAGIGVLLDDADLDIADLIVRDTADVGVWIQDAPNGGLTVVDGRVQRATRAAVASLAVERVDLEGVTLADTRVDRVPDAETGGSTPFAYGLQAFEVAGALRLVGVEVSENPVAGLYLDGGAVGAPERVDASEVSVDAEAEEALGLIVQNLGGVEVTGVQVAPALRANDEAFLEAGDALQPLPRVEAAPATE